jgi:hypothetical protein
MPQRGGYVKKLSRKAMDRRGRLKQNSLARKVQLVNNLQSWSISPLVGAAKNIMTVFNVAFRMRRDLFVAPKIDKYPLSLRHRATTPLAESNSHNYLRERFVTLQRSGR